MNQSANSLDETPITSLSTEETQTLPPYWDGKDFYTLGFFLQETNQVISTNSDLSEYDFSQPRTIWILIGDSVLSQINQIHVRLHKRSRVLVMIHPETLNNIDWGALKFLISDDRFYFVPMQVIEKQANVISKLMDDEKFDNWKPVMSPMASVEWIHHYREMMRILTPLINRKLVTKATNLASTHLFLRNALINIPLTCSQNKWEDYINIYKNKPALIIATGPSLNKQLDLIKKYQDNFVIIAVDPAIPILKSKGIVPDFVMTIDPKKRPYWKQDELDDKTTFVVDVSACPDGAWSSTKNYLMTSGHRHVYALLKDLKCNIGWIVTGGSVSTNAFSLAEHMGCNPIVMVGQDLAWTDGKDHADGYTSQYTLEKLKKRHELGYDIVGYLGQKVRTEPQLLYYKSWFEQQIKSKKKTLL